MRYPFTNAHIHVFNSACAPDRFLRILPINFVRRFSGPIKSAIDTKYGRKVINTMFKAFTLLNSRKRTEVDKYISFLDVGTDASQMLVFERALAAGRLYDPMVRIVGLTMNMDYMDSVPSTRQISFTTQLEQVKDIKRYYPANFFPFLGIDPRHKPGEEMVEFAKHYFETGIEHKGKVYPYFSGLKLYPALGFFPQDPRLRDIYAYAEKNELPVMSHCTRVGSQYIGALIEQLIPREPNMIEPKKIKKRVMVEGKEKEVDVENEAFAAARKSIHERIERFYNKKYVKNSLIGSNDNACDLFGHPENYITLFETFPRLKICLAHMGGTTEIFSKTPKSLTEIRKADGTSWFEMIWEMMKKYPGLYTDISYTLTDLDNKEVRSRIIALLESKDVNGNSLSDRVLFGTDFFMTEQERREPELYALAQKELAKWWDKITRENPQRFLKQPV